MSLPSPSLQSRAGAACLLAGPLAGLASVLIVRTESLTAADRAAAWTAHPTATHAGLAVNAIAVVLLAAGVVWFAWTTHERSPRLATAGGVLGVLGLFAITCDDAIHVAGSVAVSGMTAAQATPVADRLFSGGVTAAGILSELGDIGVILLAVAALKIGVPRWGAATLIVGVIAEGLGFAAGSRYLAAVGFALTLVGVATVVRTALTRAPAPTIPTAIVQHA
jgi:hypothetical protein